MTERNAALQEFVRLCSEAFERHAKEPEARRSVARVFALAENAFPPSNEPGQRLPACSYLDQALELDTSDASLIALVKAFREIEPMLSWRPKSNPDVSASSNFADGHANAMILGPGGLEVRSDIWLGVTLMAPDVRYPNHDHGPEEVYLVLSEGEFRHGDSGWFSPGVGGSFYNTPMINHAMRSGDKPLFAFWALLAE